MMFDVYGVRRLADKWQVFVRGTLEPMCMCDIQEKAHRIAGLLNQAVMRESYAKAAHNDLTRYFEERGDIE